MGGAHFVPHLEEECALNCRDTNFPPQVRLFSRGPLHVDEGGVKRGGGS